jgi:hypothetical protein
MSFCVAARLHASKRPPQAPHAVANAWRLPQYGQRMSASLDIDGGRISRDQDE